MNHARCDVVTSSSVKIFKVLFCKIVFSVSYVHLENMESFCAGEILKNSFKINEHTFKSAIDVSHFTRGNRSENGRKVNSLVVNSLGQNTYPYVNDCVRRAASITVDDSLRALF